MIETVDFLIYQMRRFGWLVEAYHSVGPERGSQGCPGRRLKRSEAPCSEAWLSYLNSRIATAFGATF